MTTFNVLLHSFLLAVATLQYVHSSAVNSSEIHVTLMNETYADGRGPSDMPEVIQLKFQVAGQQVQLNLTKSEYIHCKAPVYVGTDDNQINKMEESSLDDFGVYTDREKSASIIYRNHQTNGGTNRRKFSGNFRMGTSEYNLEPASPEHHDRVKRDLGDEASTEDTYIVYADAGDSGTYDGDIFVRRREENAPAMFARELLDFYQAPASYGRQIYFVETYWILDYGIYDKWWNLAHSQRSEDRHLETINNIRYYFTHIANGVDMRYQSIDDSDFGLTVKLVGFYIAGTPGGAPWSERYREHDGVTKYVEVYNMLDDLIDWTDEQIRNGKLPYFDQGTVFTGYQPFNDYNREGKRRRINGLAEIEGVCTKYKISVNKDQGIYASTQTAAHEMGHSLGAIHDGPNNNCESSHQYIMAISPGGLTTSNFKNVFTFSHCSREEMRRHFNYLRMQNRNCLMNAVTNVDQQGIDKHLERLPGQMFSPDDQCRYIHGPESYYCAGQESDAEICFKLVCYHPIQRECFNAVEIRAANGTTCGNHKWCIFGKCTLDPQAPAAPDYCASGDYLGELSDKSKCEDITLTPWKCYIDLYKEPCCRSCSLIRNDSNPTCVYGDKVSWCRNVRRTDCYSASTRGDCCATCAKFKNAIYPRCEYGDKASWCPTTREGSCYVNSQTCCETCAKRREENTRLGRFPETCIFGDKASWCSDLNSRPTQCYLSGHTCCATCHSRKTGIPSCEYGDKITYCRGVDCTDDYNQRKCCLTCSAYTGLTRPPPTQPPIRTTTAPTTIRTTTVPTTRTSTTSIRPRPPPTTRPTSPHAKCIMAGADLAGWCQQASFFIGICYQSAHICCITCASADRGTDNCRYGDHISWCKDISASQCYDRETEQDCCHTCSRLYNHQRPAECRYGDQYSWCQNQNRRRCSEPDFKKMCCSTCSDYQEPSSTTTISTTRMTTTLRTTTRPGATKAITTTSPTTTSTIPTTPATSSTMERTTPTTPTSTSTSTTISTTRTVVTFKPIECPRGDEASWCATIPSSYCYTIEHTCCATCQNKLKHHMPQACKYGDKYTWCSNLRQDQCSRQQIREDCCQLCQAWQEKIEETHNTNDEDDECKGDTEDWCPSVSPRECYDSRTHDRCCESCQNHETNINGCPFGDHALWCDSDKFYSRNCYQDHWVCCQTCRKQHYIGVKGCEYGDKSSVCDGLDCSDPLIRDVCCKTCTDLHDDIHPLTESTRPITVAPPNHGCVRDEVTWCNKIKGFHCYSDQDVCCNTCIGAYLGFKGCEYGDRVSWCAEAVKDPKDCDRKDIGERCCYTCTIQGNPSTRETPEDWSEGVIVGFLNKHMSQVVDGEVDVLTFLSHQVNDYCVEHPSFCCSYLDSATQQGSPRAAPIDEIKQEAEQIPSSPVDPLAVRVVQPTDMKVAGGYPRYSDLNDGEIITKYLVSLRKEALEDLCGVKESGDSKSRRKRAADDDSPGESVYFDKYILKEMIVENKDKIENALGIQISRVNLAGETETTSLKVALGVATGAFLAFAIVAIVLAITVKKLTKYIKDMTPKDKEELFRQTPVPMPKGRNKVSDWSTISGSMSSLSTISNMTSDVYLSNTRLPSVEFAQHKRQQLNRNTGLNDTLRSIPRPFTSIQSPPPPYSPPKGLKRTDLREDLSLHPKVFHAWPEDDTESRFYVGQ